MQFSQWLPVPVRHGGSRVAADASSQYAVENMKGRYGEELRSNAKRPTLFSSFHVWLETLLNKHQDNPPRRCPIECQLYTIQSKHQPTQKKKKKETGSRK
ncbi:hypothetical protein E2C01_032108 [Portunus trituberculatus]|uniref:Uncharacterized protein n=1 Tax=Portunus trituberculatus TaxID=210409 RepID=A0A5B7F032_PORTR|nr:hypothetical protein [Portunus trituberculatus]